MYKVGREDVDFVLTQDRTISRVHASLLVLSDGRLAVKDEKSKYGVFVNAKQISKDKETNLKEADKVRFGRGTYDFVVCKHSFLCLTSTLKDTDRAALAGHLEKLGGQLESAIGTSTHLVMSQAAVTVKLLQAMVKGIPIVTVKYFEALLSAASTNMAFPKPDDFLPDLEERYILDQNVSFATSVQRQSLFENKTFYFFSKRQYECYKLLIESAKGKCFCLSNKTVSKQKLVAPDAIVVQYEKDSSQTQSTSAARKLVI